MPKQVMPIVYAYLHAYLPSHANYRVTFIHTMPSCPRDHALMHPCHVMPHAPMPYHTLTCSMTCHVSHAMPFHAIASRAAMIQQSDMASPIPCQTQQCPLRCHIMSFHVVPVRVVQSRRAVSCSHVARCRVTPCHPCHRVLLGTASHQTRQ